jgi:hypothetical protein
VTPGFPWYYLADSVLIRVTLALVLGLGVWVGFIWSRLHREVVRRRDQVESLQRIGRELTRALDNFRRNNPETEDRQMEVGLADVPEPTGLDAAQDDLMHLFEAATEPANLDSTEGEAYDRLLGLMEYDAATFEREQTEQVPEKTPRTSFERVLNDDED